MKRNKKLTLIALVAMLFMAVAVTFLSFSKADEDLSGDDINLVAAGSAVEIASKTNIDYIIQNSNSTDTEVDPYYHIVEIYSGSPSSLKDFVVNKNFESLVINENKTIDDMMKTGYVKYTSYAASSITDDSTEELVAISNADLIYVNQDSTPFKSPSNDLCEDLYNILHTYAVGDYRPIIFNSEAASGSNSGKDSSTKTSTVGDLISGAFSSGSYYYTFAWKDGVDVTDFLIHKNGSLYLGINGTKQLNKGKWNTLVDASDDTNTISMAKFLVISSNGTSTSSKWSELIDGSTEFTDIANYLATDGEAYDAGGSKIYTAGTRITEGVYNRKYDVPYLVQVDEKTLADVGADDFDLAKYDFIFIDDSVGGASTLSSDLYTKFAGAMYGNVSIVYDGNLATSTTSSTGTTVSNTQDSNYHEIYYMVATSDNLSRYTNVMITNKTQFDVITSGNASAAGAIADLINASTYRGIGGKGSSSSMFTVLEIQPCYPIDPEVEKYNLDNGKFGYYNTPADVLNDVDKDTLRNADGTITTEHYDWELTKSKIADALRIDESQINIVHMSTEELAASKEPILGTYDLIYIGGNTSALQSGEGWRSVVGLMNWAGGVGGQVSVDNMKFLPIYTMYTHNGDLANTTDATTASFGQSGGPGSRGGTPATFVTLNGKNKASFALLNGNDFTYDRFKELEKYVDAGMPVIVESSVATAYEAMVNNASNEAVKNDIIINIWKSMDYNQQQAMAQTIGLEAWQVNNQVNSGDYSTVIQLLGSQAGSINFEYLQNAIDPDCNVRKFLDVCAKRQTADGTKNTVLWGLPNSSDDSTFVNDTYVYDLVNGSTKRPKLTVTSLPVTYNFYDMSTRLDEGKLNFAFEVAGSNKYTTKLYVDDDGDSIFESEMDAEVTNNTLKCTLADTYFGPVYWKLEVKDDKTEMTAYVTGVSYVKNKNNQKQTVRVLQIMPGEAVVSGNTIKASTGEGADGTSATNSLYFCPICQNAYQRLEYNPQTDDDSQYNFRYSGNYTERNSNSSDTSRTSQKPYLGRHKHIFGIPWYKSDQDIDGRYTGADDWSTNLADDVSDLYDFDLDILLRSEFEDVSQGIHDAYYGASEATMTTAINSFTISQDDPDIAVWNACTTDAEKYRFILKRDYEKKANDANQIYNDAKADVDAKEALLITAMDKVINNNEFGYARDLAVVKKTTRYSDIFSCVSSTGKGLLCYHYSNGESSDLNALANAFFDYRDALDVQIKALDEYKMYNRYANYENWLLGCYDMIIIGPSDMFGADDIQNDYALADLKEYADNFGSMLLFHDTLTASKDSYSWKLTSTLRGSFGMDRNKGLSTTVQDGLYYLPYTSTDPDRYFMTNLSYKSTSDTSRYASWVSDIKGSAFSNFSINQYLTKVAYTDAINIGNDNYNQGLRPYKYADIFWTKSAHSFQSAKQNEQESRATGNYGTEKASQNNKGIVTQYPFTLSDELNIAGTHPQAYALDLEDSHMTVWYSLAGGYNQGTKSGNPDRPSESSLFAASRNDGMDSYFIYSYKNVNYCGAGHSKVTGIGKDNNDERRLYINIIVNSVKQSVNQPSITVYDYQTTNKKDKDGTTYLMQTGDPNSYPEFSFMVNVDTSVAGNNLKRVRIYYDLDYLITNSDVFIEDGDTNHILIADMTQGLQSGVVYDVGKSLTRLKLDPRYFEPYNNEYTYIVIEATDTEGNIVYQRIKIKLLPHLFDLT